MIRFCSFVCGLIGLMQLCIPAHAQEGDEELAFYVSSKEFENSFDSAAKILEAAGLVDDMESGGLFAVSNDEFDRLVLMINQEEPIAEVASGVANHRYDVILQPGHYGRTKGRVGTSGSLVSERALVAHMVRQMTSELSAKGLDVLVVSADDFLRNSNDTPEWNGLSAKAFLAVHADGNERPCTTGPSIGYESSNSLLGMHAIGLGLSTALGVPYDQFRRDNLTVNTAKYYMFGHVHAEVEGVLEVGELTCEKTERQLIELSREISINVARSLAFVAELH